MFPFMPQELVHRMFDSLTLNDIENLQLTSRSCAQHVESYERKKVLCTAFLTEMSVDVDRPDKDAVFSIHYESRNGRHLSSEDVHLGSQLGHAVGSNLPVWCSVERVDIRVVEGTSLFLHQLFVGGPGVLSDCLHGVRQRTRDCTVFARLNCPLTPQCHLEAQAAATRLANVHNFASYSIVPGIDPERPVLRYYELLEPFEPYLSSSSSSEEEDSDAEQLDA